MKYFWTAIGLVLILWLSGIIFSFGVIRLPDFVQPSLDATVPVHGGQRIKQEFISQHNNLSSIGISIQNRWLRNKKDIILTIWEGTTPIRTVTENGLYIQDGKFVRFDFMPIPDSENKKYVLEFAAPSATEADSLEIFLTKEQNFSQAGTLLVSELPYTEYRAIGFTSFHKPEAKLTALQMILSDFMQRLGKDVGFIIGFIGIIAVLLFIGKTKKFDKYFEKFN